MNIHLTAIRILLVLVSLSLFPLVSGQDAIAVSSDISPFPDQSPSIKAYDVEPWHITASQLTFYHRTGVIIGGGGVRVWRGNLSVAADWMIYDQRKSKVYARGSVLIRLGQDVLTGSEGLLDLETYTGTVTKAHLFLKRNNVHLVARQLWKTGPEEYKAKDAVVSTCPLPKQAWNFKCRDLNLTVNGLAVAKHTTFNIHDVPVFYSPWLAAPINRYRKTGFLLPTFSASKRNGVEINVPFFWAINDSMDATFYQHPMTKRGWMEGVEFRYLFSRKTKGIVRYNILSDRLDDRDYNEDGITRKNERRWWLRAKADHKLPWNLEAKLDIDLVSDLDYLQEFDSGPMGYEKTNRAFLKYFGRSLTDDTNLIRPSTLQVTRGFKNQFVGSEIRYNDNLIPGEQDTTVQILPRLAALGFSQKIPHTPLFYDWNASYVRYWREDGIRDNRLHLEPRLTLPFRLWGGWADFMLNASALETVYQVSGQDDDSTISDNPNRLLFRLGGDLSSTLARVYRQGTDLELRHTIEPRITYEFTSEEDQTDLPNIDTLDRIQPSNKLTWSLISYLSSKRRLSEGHYSYLDVIRLSIKQGYDFRKDYHPLDPLYGEITFRPSPRISLRYDTTYDFYGLGFTTYNLWGNMSSEAGDQLKLAYRYNKVSDIRELNIDLWAVLSPSWYGIYRTKRSFSEEAELESEYGLRYQSSCWSFEIRYKKDQDESRITCHIELLGIGGWGRE